MVTKRNSGFSYPMGEKGLCRMYLILFYYMETTL
nr:MAG TPA: hypothetical protein [Bacteriophage sp.]